MGRRENRQERSHGWDQLTLLFPCCRYFLPVSGALTQFANRRNLIIEKYYQEVPMWSLCFSHPNGGQAKLDVIRDSQQTVRFMGCNGSSTIEFLNHTGYYYTAILVELGHS
jgi:hypothetical protein